MPIARYTITFGLSGCYMPDSVNGPYLFTTRRDLAATIRSELAMCDMPACLFRQANIRRLWHFIAKHGSSTAHFALHHGANALEFHGLTEAEFNEQNTDH